VKKLRKFDLEFDNASLTDETVKKGDLLYCTLSSECIFKGKIYTFDKFLNSGNIQVKEIPGTGHFPMRFYKIEDRYKELAQILYGKVEV
jgi:hypothetical protein